MVFIVVVRVFEFLVVLWIYFSWVFGLVICVFKDIDMVVIWLFIFVFLCVLWIDMGVIVIRDLVGSLFLLWRYFCIFLFMMVSMILFIVVFVWWDLILWMVLRLNIWFLIILCVEIVLLNWVCGILLVGMGRCRLFDVKFLSKWLVFGINWFIEFI